jgi:hypothetical protein
VYLSPQTPIEAGLAKIWTEVVGLEQIGMHDNFFDPGSHSLLATQLISRVRSMFQLDLPIRVLCAAPTIAELAVAVIQHQVAQCEHAELVRFQSRQQKPLAFEPFIVAAKLVLTRSLIIITVYCLEERGVHAVVGDGCGQEGHAAAG